MSIHTEAAVRELNKEIDRLVAIRDSLLAGPSNTPKPVTAVVTNAAPKKRKMSAATKKKIGDAARKRFAAKKAAEKKAAK